MKDIKIALLSWLRRASLAVEFGKKLPVVGFDINCNVLKNWKAVLTILLKHPPATWLKQKNWFIQPILKICASVTILFVTVPTPIEDLNARILRP